MTLQCAQSEIPEFAIIAGMVLPFQNLPRYSLGTSKLETSEVDAAPIVILSLPLDEAARTFLTKVLESIKIEEEDIRILTIEKTDQVRISNALNLAGKTILCFGLTSEQLGLAVTHTLYSVLRLYTYSILFAEDLDQIQTSVASKRKLWNSIQDLFQNDE